MSGATPVHVAGFTLFFFFSPPQYGKTYETKPICVQNCLGHSVPTPKRKATAHIKPQKVTVTTDIPGIPLSQGFLL